MSSVIDAIVSYVGVAGLIGLFILYVLSKIFGPLANTYFKHWLEKKGHSKEESTSDELTVPDTSSQPPAQEHNGSAMDHTLESKLATWQEEVESGKFQENLADGRVDTQSECLDAPLPQAESKNVSIEPRRRGWRDNLRGEHPTIEDEFLALKAEVAYRGNPRTICKVIAPEAKWTTSKKAQSIMRQEISIAA